MDILGVVRSAPVVDLGILVALFAAFILGVMQGSIRRVLGILSLVFAFLVAANLRDSLADMLNSNWRQFSEGYNRLLAFLILFVALAIIFSALIQGMYKRTDIYARQPIVDDVIGGLLGLFEGFVILTIVVIILNSHVTPSPAPGDVDQVRSAQDALLNQSNIGRGIKDNVAPTVVHVFSGLLPADLGKQYP